MPGLSHADDLVLWGETEEDLKVMVGRFVDVYKRRGLKFNADKNKVMGLGGEEGLGCEIRVERVRMSKCQSSNIWGEF